MKRTLYALIVLLLLPFATTHAAVTISVSENGADVVATSSGTLNLVGLGTAFANTAFDGFVLGLNDASIISTGVNPGVLTRYLIPVTPLPFMVAGSPFVESDLSSGTMVEIRTYIGDVTYVSVPEGYQSGTSIDSTSTWQGTTIAGLGLVPGTYVFDWVSGATADSLTLNIEDVSPAPALTLDKTADVTTYSTAGDIIAYSYLVTASEAAVAGPITVTDDKLTVTCPAVDTVGNNDDNLDPAESITCTASYAVVAADITNGSITNVASASGDAGNIVSPTDTVTVTYVAPPTYSVGGTVSGLTGTGLELQNNGGDTLAVAAAATDFTFATELLDLATYAVTVSTQPTGQTCEVTSGSDTIAAADVTDVGVACVDDVVPPIDPPTPAVPIPTLSQWALIMLSMLLGLMVFSNRKRLL